MDCLFCKIAKGGIKGEVVYEDDHALAFLDIMPRALGHTLVIPKVHAATLLELPDAEIGPLFAAVQKVDAMIMNRLVPDGATIGINQGTASGQEVAHLHVHILPRWANDGGGAIQSVVNHKGDAAIAEIGKKIRGE